MSRNTFYDYIIVGGGIAGVSAAEAIRANDKYASISILSEEPELLYSRVMLPLYVRGKIKREQLFLRAANDYERHNIALWLDERVVEINRKKREIATDRKRVLNYKKLLIATGGVPSQWKESGAQTVKMLQFQSINDADELRALLALGSKGGAVVVGSGFIGFEFIEFFVSAGFHTAVVSPDPWYFHHFFDSEGAEIIKESFIRHNVEVYNDAHIVSIAESPEGIHVKTKENLDIVADAIGAGVGLKRKVEMFEKAGLVVSRGVYTNEYLKTNDDNIYAAGDIAEYYDVVFRKRMLLGTWNNAFLQGKTAGENMTGKEIVFRNVPNYSIRHFGLYISMVGDCARSEADSVIKLRWPYTDQYRELHLREGILNGALLINRPQDRNILEQLIKKRVDVRSHVNDLQSAHFDIHQLTA